MTDQERKAMEMALDSLVECARLLGSTQAKKGHGIYTADDAKFEVAMYESIYKHKAALRQALDHVPEPDMGIDRGAWDDVPDATKWVDELRGGDETEQGPVAWITRRTGDGGVVISGYETCEPTDYDAIPVYTAPTKREWQELTDEDWHNLPTSNKQGCERDAEIFDWIEDKLKEKNT